MGLRSNLSQSQRLHKNAVSDIFLLTLFLCEMARTLAKLAFSLQKTLPVLDGHCVYSTSVHIRRRASRPCLYRSVLGTRADGRLDGCGDQQHGSSQGPPNAMPHTPLWCWHPPLLRITFRAAGWCGCDNACKGCHQGSAQRHTSRPRAGTERFINM